MNSTVFGVDVGKDFLDIAGGGAGHRRVPNDDAAIAAIVARWRGRPGLRVIVEPTGRFHLQLCIALAEAGIAVVVVNPRFVRRFAQAQGHHAKTDRLDAATLAAYGAAMPDLVGFRLPSATGRQLGLWQRRRQQLAAMAREEKQRLAAVGDDDVAAAIAAHVAWMTAEIAAVEARCAALIEGDETLAARFAILVSAPGVGPVVAGVLLAMLPELGTLDRGRIAALAGLAPFNDDSGRRRGPRHVAHGRSEVRRVLYIAAMADQTAKKSGTHDLYARLRASGRCARQALVACARKLLVRLNAMLRDMTPYDHHRHTHVPTPTAAAA